MWMFRSIGGKIEWAPQSRVLLDEDVREHSGAVYEVKRRTKESKDMRNFFEGGLVPLYLFFTGRNWRDTNFHDDAREEIKRGFNGEMRKNPLTGKWETFGKTSIGELQRIIHELEDWLVENYQMPDEAVDTKKYENWRDTIFPRSGPDNWIDYLLTTGTLKMPKQTNL